MQEIPLTQGYIALVDDTDMVLVSCHKWCVNRCRGKVYAGTSINGRSIRMHRVILGVRNGGVVDHRDRNTLNNTRANLRICTHKENVVNSPGWRGSFSRFKGVSWDNQRSKFLARIFHEGKAHNLGRFNIEEDAAIAYNNAATEMFGSFAYLNEIGVPQ